MARAPESVLAGVVVLASNNPDVNATTAPITGEPTEHQTPLVTVLTRRSDLALLLQAQLQLLERRERCALLRLCGLGTGGTDAARPGVFGDV